MSKLLDYLNTLDKDAAVRDAHKKDPKGAMKKFGLTDQEQDALMSGDKNKVAALAGIRVDELPSVQIPEATF